MTVCLKYLENIGDGGEVTYKYLNTNIELLGIPLHLHQSLKAVNRFQGIRNGMCLYENSDKTRGSLLSP